MKLLKKICLFQIQFRAICPVSVLLGRDPNPQPVPPALQHLHLVQIGAVQPRPDPHQLQTLQRQVPGQRAPRVRLLLAHSTHHHAGHPPPHSQTLAVGRDFMEKLAKEQRKVLTNMAVNVDYPGLK